MREIYDVLADDGVWVFEQSYMPTMLETNSYDTVCHEHLEFYAMHQIKWMADRVGFKIVDVEFNDVNGGSFSVTVSKSLQRVAIEPLMQRILAEEHAKGLDTLAPYHAFAKRAAAHIPPTPAPMTVIFTACDLSIARFCVRSRNTESDR
jgi:NDP-4-keto-2,6-dideoxyhexose 3-C-methyltransferase